MDALTEYKQILLKEREVKDEYVRAFTEWKRFIVNLNGAVAVADEVEETHFMMGSLADGGFSARMFSEEQFNFEGDFLVEIADLPREAITQVPNKPGFYSVKNDGNFLNYLIGAARFFLNDPRTMGAFLKTFFHLKYSHGCIVGQSIKTLVDLVAQLRDGEDEVTRIMNTVFGVQGENLVCNMETLFNGPAATQIMKILIDGSHVFTLYFDVVVGARLSFWPPEAGEFETRDRKWPNPDVIKEIIQEHKVHLVAKPSNDLQVQESSEWRLTFLAEKRIIQEQTPVMKLTYYLLKTLFYANFKEEIDGKTLASYLAKTTMYWACEELNPEIWTEENVNANLKLLLKRLFDGLDSGYIPHYFVRRINLLNNVSPRLLDAAKNIDRDRLLNDPIQCLPSDFNQVNDRLDNVINICVNWGRHYNDLTQGVISQRGRGIVEVASNPQDENLDNRTAPH